MNEVEKYGLFAIIAVAALITALTLSADDETTPAAAAVSAGQPVAIAVPDPPAKAQSKGPAAKAKAGPGGRGASGPAASGPVGTKAVLAAPPLAVPNTPAASRAADASDSPRSVAGGQPAGRRLPVPKHVPSLITNDDPFDPDEPPVVYPGERSWTPPARAATTTAPKSHVVAAGDTLSSIAKTYLGRATRWNEIAALNPGLDPERLQVGQTVVVSAAPRAARTEAVASAPAVSQAKLPAGSPTGSPSASAERFVIVQAGDTLGEIAMRELGSVRHTDALFDANRDVLASPDALAVGQRLRLPRP